MAPTIPSLVIDPVAVCGCGRRYSFLEWHRLPYRGLQSAPAGSDPVAEPAFILELRDCQSAVLRNGHIETCNSTISREVTPDSMVSTGNAFVFVEELMDPADLAAHRVVAS